MKGTQTVSIAQSHRSQQEENTTDHQKKNKIITAFQLYTLNQVSRIHIAFFVKVDKGVDLIFKF